ncbi:hypothetical protein [Erythrobacter sp. YT30]|uniref:hypothetical protein n=1 Tax=Erythrobacter sp. YT30 TaxID=1735012 RepID=UPI0012E3A2B6|nr:hypothetical protein [Erythrobacter sp. YT30]
MSGFLDRREYTFTEMATVGCFLAASVAAAILAFRHWRDRKDSFIAILFIGFAATAFLVAMEEVQWGQPILGYDIPGFIEGGNRQNEMTLHNLEGMHGKAGRFYMVFCIAALTLSLPRVWLLSDNLWSAVKSPKALLPIVLLILLMALLKVYAEIFENPFKPIQPIRWTTEIAELLIAYWCVAYIVIKLIELRGKERKRASSA